MASKTNFLGKNNKTRHCIEYLQNGRSIRYVSKIWGATIQHRIDSILKRIFYRRICHNNKKCATEKVWKNTCKFNLIAVEGNAHEEIKYSCSWIYVFCYRGLSHWGILFIYSIWNRTRSTIKAKKKQRKKHVCFSAGILVSKCSLIISWGYPVFPSNR